MRTVTDYIKMVLSVLLVLACALSCGLRLMKIQVVESESYITESVTVTTYTQEITATRGKIVDSTGLTIVGNDVNYAIVIDESSFPSDYAEGNAILLELVTILQDAEIEWEDSLPISMDSPYTFDEDTSSDVLSKMKTTIGVNQYATAQNCIAVLVEDYEISSDYTEEEQRILAGIRYTMLAEDFSMSVKFQLAEGLSLETVTCISEERYLLDGVSIQKNATRVIEVGDVVPHEIGTTGPIYAENADEYLEKGYSLDAVVGVSGIEKAMEDELQGTSGTRTITFEDGVAVSDEITEEVVSGHTVMLTINAEFQRGLQEILEDFIADFPSINQKDELSTVSAGAIVVLDVETGAILGEVTYPTYDLTTYSENYAELLEAEDNPLYNRATMGLYRPGSTFKTITATAGLNEGVVGGGTYFNCTKTYTYIDTDYSCTGTHGYISIARALMVSCNSYFYELSRLLTIDRLVEYAALYGIGQNTGIETQDSAGYMASPETYSSLGVDWTVGAVLQAGIGNGETMVTPLQLACVALTIANEGVRYTPYLVDSVWDYDMDTCLYETEPTVAAEIELTSSMVYYYIEQGMILASTNNFPDAYNLTDLGYDVAIKTGTPQVESRVQDSVFIGYAPADNPKIAFAGVIEGGDYSKYMIRSILKLYEEVYGSMYS